jgi:hypothetical protein
MARASSRVEWVNPFRVGASRGSRDRAQSLRLAQNVRVTRGTRALGARIAARYAPCFGGANHQELPMTVSHLDNDALHQDFLAHLQARLGLSSEATAIATLGGWMSTYEPGPTARALAKKLPRARRGAA